MKITKLIFPGPDPNCKRNVSSLYALNVKLLMTQAPVVSKKSSVHKQTYLVDKWININQQFCRLCIWLWSESLCHCLFTSHYWSVTRVGLLGWVHCCPITFGADDPRSIIGSKWWQRWKTSRMVRYTLVGGFKHAMRAPPVIIWFIRPFSYSLLYRLR